MKCSQCGSEWFSHIEKEQCPFCGASIHVNPEQDFDDIPALITYLIETYGTGILLETGRVMSFISDLIVAHDRDKRLFRTGCHNRVLQDVYQVMLETKQPQREVMIMKIRYRLEKEAFLSENSVTEILDMTLKGVGLYSLRSVYAGEAFETQQQGGKEITNAKQQQEMSAPKPTQVQQEPPASKPTQAQQEPSAPKPTQAQQEPPASKPTQAQQEPPVPKPTQAQQEPPASKPTQARQEPPASKPTQARQEPPVPKPTQARQEPPAPKPTQARQEPPAPKPTQVRQEPSASLNRMPVRIVTPSMAAVNGTLIGLRMDGTVFTAAVNGTGDIDMKKREGVVSLSTSGQSYVAELRADGRVTIAGTVDDGLREAEQWRDIVAVSAGNHILAGLRANGTVLVTADLAVSAGWILLDNIRRAVGKWKNITAVATGDRYVACLRNDGRVAAAGENREGECEVSGWRGIVAIAGGDPHTVGLKSDGTVVATGRRREGQCDVGDWKNIKSIAAGKRLTVGLHTNGKVSITDVRIDIRQWRSIVAVYASGEAVFGVKSDGSVLVAGVSAEYKKFLSSCNLFASVTAKAAPPREKPKNSGRTTSAPVSGEKEPDKCMMMCKCSKTRQVFGLRLRRQADGDWIRSGTVRQLSDADKRELPATIPVKGSLKRMTTYPGCPYCGAMGITECPSCRRVMCGATEAIGSGFVCMWCGRQIDVMNCPVCGERLSKLHKENGEKQVCPRCKSPL